MTIRWLVTGAGGMLGTDLYAALLASGAEASPRTRADLDVTDPDACLAAVAGHDVVVNCAAWTKVDDAEDHEPAAFAVNAVGAANLARACAAYGARLVQVSTDYVFDGRDSGPYAEDAPVAPRSAYGRTKAAGEWAVRALCPRTYVVRTAWLYGEHGPNFVSTMARLARERDQVSVVDDQRGQPTWTVDVCAAVLRLVEADAAYGVYHATSTGQTTWFGFTREIFAGLGLDPGRVLPTTSAQFVRPAPRPANSVLGHDAWAGAGLPALPDWSASLRRALPLVVQTEAP